MVTCGHKKCLSSFFTNILLFQEIGAALLNLRSGLIESEFHEFVRPKERPNLSEYCINLTRITQELINRQDTFTIVYPRFIEWLNGISTEKQLRFAEPNQRSTQNNRNASFCTWTWWDKILQSFGNSNQLTTSLMLIYFFFISVIRWDLGHFFRVDCQRNGIRPPQILKTWVDARKIFEVSSFWGFFLLKYLDFHMNFRLIWIMIIFIQRTHPGRYTFSEALKFIDIEQDVNAHSAIADAKNLVKMMVSLNISGAQISQATDWKAY